VMVASSIASKGLDFAEIQHVINFSMPKEIEVSCVLAFSTVVRTDKKLSIGLRTSNWTNRSKW
jgi:hypothetical protein